MTHLQTHVAAYRNGTIKTYHLRRACPFAFPPPDETEVAELIQRTVKDEGHRGILPKAHSVSAMDPMMTTIMDFLRTVPGATSPAIARILELQQSRVAQVLEKLMTRGDVDRSREASKNWVWRVK